MKRIVPLFLVLSCLPWPAAADEPVEHAARPPMSDAAHWATVFDAESRNEWQKPLTVIEFLGVQPGDVVADLGAGTGYFTKLLAIRTGFGGGKVYAVDVEQAMLDYLMQREDMLTEHVVPVLAEPDDPHLPEGKIALVLVVDTWHHIENRPKYLKRLARCLHPHGRVAIVDFREGELPVGPPPGEKLARDVVVEEFRGAGWTLTSESMALPYQYVLVFYPPRKKPLPPIVQPQVEASE